MYKVKDLYDGKVHEWTLQEVLEEINRDHSDDWVPYDESDWEEGWENWCEGVVYTMLGDEEKQLRDLFILLLDFKLKMEKQKGGNHLPQEFKDNVYRLYTETSKKLQNLTQWQH